VLTAVREAARRLGAERLFPEVTIRRAGLTGRVDLRADGARGLGHIEVKVVANLPDAPRQRDLHQASLYLALTNGRPPAWAALIYVSMLSGEARYFVFSDALTSLMKSTSVFPVRNRLGR
jgi:hypothetical protein